jgi:arginase family enzyme
VHTTQRLSGGQNPEPITAAIRSILGRGAIPIALGTDVGGFIPFVRAYGGCAALCIAHIDAHIDWRNERAGVTGALEMINNLIVLTPVSYEDTNI